MLVKDGLVISAHEGTPAETPDSAWLR
jgi:hypothetical protein